MAPIRQSINNISSNHLNNIDVENDVNNEELNDICLSFNERQNLKTSEIQQISDPSQEPSSDRLVHLLIQALKSKDKQMLETVLNNEDQKVMRNTIQKLPNDCIDLFLGQLQSCLSNKGEKTLIYMKWLKELMQMRQSFIETLPNLEQEFGPLLQLYKGSTDVLKGIFRLKGRLNLILSQINTQNSTEYMTRQEPRLEYDSSSPSDDEVIDEDNEEVEDSTCSEDYQSLSEHNGDNVKDLETD